MATPFVSPGVYVREIDESLFIRQLSETAIGLVGTAQWGPVNIATLINSSGQFVAKFGNPTTTTIGTNVFPEHPMIQAGFQYLRKGRNLWAIRILASGTDVNEIKATAKVYNSDPLPLGNQKGEVADDVEGVETMKFLLT